MKNQILKFLFGAAMTVTLCAAQSTPAHAEEALTPPATTEKTVALFHLDEKNGDEIFDAISQKTAGSRGAAQWSPEGGLFGGALELRARTEATTILPELKLDAAVAPSSNFSIDFRFKARDAELLKRDFYLLSSSNLYFRYTAKYEALVFGVQSPTGWIECAVDKKLFALAPQTWTQIAGSYDGKEVALTINGKRLASGAGDGGAVVWSTLVLGGVGWDTKYIATDFDGLIDEIRVEKL